MFIIPYDTRKSYGGGVVRSPVLVKTFQLPKLQNYSTRNVCVPNDFFKVIILLRCNFLKSASTGYLFLMLHDRFNIIIVASIHVSTLYHIRRIYKVLQLEYLTKTYSFQVTQEVPLVTVVAGFEEEVELKN